MGAIESTEAGNIWESATEEIARGIEYREDERYRENRYEEEPSVRGDEAAVASSPQSPVRPAASSPSPARRGAGLPSPARRGAGTPSPARRMVATPSPARRAASPAKAAAPAPAATTEPAPAAASASATTANEDESETKGETEVSSKGQKKANGVAPAQVKSNGRFGMIRISRGYLPNNDVLWYVLFVLHLVVVTAGIIFLNVVYLKDMNQRKLHNLQRWFPQLVAAVVAGSLFASLWQTLIRTFPYFMPNAVLWTSVILTLGASIMLISTSVPANLGVGVIWLLFAICLALYACWVTNRTKYTGSLLACSLKTARKFQGVYLVSFCILLASSIWLVFWSFGVVSALTFKFPPLVIFALIVSLAWTLETMRNIVCTAVGKGVARVYPDGQNTGIHWKRCLRGAVSKSSFGSVCLGSFIVPTLHCLRVVARGMSKIHGDNDFMFSCSGSFLHVMTVAERRFNNWAYVQVGVFNKPFVKASKDTWDLFKRTQLNVVIETDLTSSLCVLSGIAGGMLCVIVSGGWTFGTHKALTLSISVLSFLIGYFLTRITMAMPQGAVATHYVCYAESSTGSEFLTSPVEERLRELVGDRDNAVANEV